MAGPGNRLITPKQENADTQLVNQLMNIAAVPDPVPINVGPKTEVALRNEAQQVSILLLLLSN